MIDRDDGEPVAQDHDQVSPLIWGALGLLLVIVFVVLLFAAGAGGHGAMARTIPSAGAR